ncbi:MAG TPA: hypothetical protein VF152_11245 [Acidimicrobiia bacterium]
MEGTAMGVGVAERLARGAVLFGGSLVVLAFVEKYRSGGHDPSGR